MATSPPAPPAAPARTAPAGSTVALRAREGVWANADPRAWDTRLIVEIAMAVGLALVIGPLFSAFVPLTMPQGGSFSLEMLPLMFVAIRRGVVPGVTTGLLFGCLSLLPFFRPFIYHPAQVLLDYPLAFGAVGLAGLVPVRGGWSLWGAVAAGAGARLVFHFFSGWIFFATYAPSWEWPWLYALTYNLVYLVPETAVTAICLRPLLRAYDSAMGAARD